MKKVKSIMRVSSLGAMFATTITVKISADTSRSAYQLPSNAQVVEYLVRSANWYRHLYVERQVANEPGDLLFLDDNQTIEAQIVKLSFEFATVEAARATRATSRPYAAAAQPTAPSSDLAHFIELKDRSDEESQQAVQTISALKQKIGIARKPDRKKLNAALDDAQRRLELLHAVSQTVNDLIEFVGRVETGQTGGENLDSTINDLANSIPDLSNSAKLPAKDATSRTTDSWRDEGLLELWSELSTLKLKLGVIEEKIRLTNDLAFSNRNLRIPMTGFTSQVLRNSLISDVQTSDLASLGRQNTELRALTLQLKEFSPTIVALNKQKALLAEYNSHLLSWRTAVVSQYRHEWKKLVFRLIAITLINRSSNWSRRALAPSRISTC